MSTNDPTHRHGIRLVPFGLSLSIFLAVTFALCAIGELIPGLESIHVLSVLYPGVDWTQPGLLLAGGLQLGQLFGITPNDPWLAIATVAVLTVVSAAAGMIPATRASRIDPILALRYE